ncbi:MAG: DUF2970 domain-containing protein [Idiomarina sp.]
MSSDKHEKPSFMAVVLSVIAAFFGVQTERNRQRDFSAGKPIHYILIGVVLTVMFVVGLMGLVSLVLPDSP